MPFALPEIGEEEIAEVVDSLRSGWLTTGPKTRRFEQDFAQFLGGDVQTLAVNSATSGLHLALEAIGVGPGDEVITTPHTFTATAEVIRYLGADPVFVDIRPETLNIDPAKIEAAITPRTKAIMPVHFAGLSADMKPIHAIARKHGLRVIEDAAHALADHLRRQADWEPRKRCHRFQFLRDQNPGHRRRRNDRNAEMNGSQLAAKSCVSTASIGMHSTATTRRSLPGITKWSRQGSNTT